MDISAEWVFMLHQFVIVGILGDVARCERSLILLVAGDQFRVVPPDLLRSGLLPAGPLPGYPFRCHDSLLHGFDFEDSVDAGGVERDRTLVVLRVRPDKCLQVARVAWVSMHRFLGDEFN